MLTPFQIEMAQEFGVLCPALKIDSEFLHDMMYMLMLARESNPEKRLELRIHGTGGDTDVAFGIADLIDADGNIDSVAVGSVISAHIIIWASASRRYVMPHGWLGVHPAEAYAPPDSTASREELTEISASLDLTNDEMAAYYADRSSRSLEWWKSEISKGGKYAHEIVSTEVIAIGFARPYSELLGERAKKVWDSNIVGMVIESPKTVFTATNGLSSGL